MNSSLYLFPEPVLQSPPPLESILDALGQVDFIGERLGDNHYLAGADFFKHITFAGCSPHLQLAMPEEGGWDFCHIRLHADLLPTPLQIAPMRGRPRCASCGANLPHWKQQLSVWTEDSSQQYRCEHCGQLSAVAELNWRGYGVGARCRIEILQVYPGEAMPGDSLMRQLADATGKCWRHAWADSIA